MKDEGLDDGKLVGERDDGKTVGMDEGKYVGIAVGLHEVGVKDDGLDDGILDGVRDEGNAVGLYVVGEFVGDAVVV